MNNNRQRTRKLVIAALMSFAVLLGNLIVVKPDAVRAAAPGLEIFGTGVGRPQTLVPAANGDYYVVDTDRRIWSLPGEGGAGTLLATLDYSLRDGAFLPHSFGSLAGRFLIVGGVATTNTPALASTMDQSFQISPYASQPGSLWSGTVIPTASVGIRAAC